MFIGIFNRNNLWNKIKKIQLEKVKKLLNLVKL